MRRRIEAGVLVALAAVLTFGCSPEVPDINVSTIVNNIFGQGGTGGPSDVPGGATPAEVKLGCFGMTAPGGGPLPDCSAGLAQYDAPVGTKGILNATPKDAQGLDIHGLSVESWTVAGSACSVTGEDSGPDGFTPDIELVEAGCCAVAVRVAGVTGGPRTFCGL